MRYGYKASAEQFAPRELIGYSALAEDLGLETIAVSDHFQPWRHHGGHTPAVLPWLGALGERTRHAVLGTSVLTPTMRYHPSVVAQAFATLACLNPGRVFLGVGTGEALNETPATAGEWPGPKERRLMLRESIELIRRLWSEDRVTFDGEYYRTDRATIYDRPETRIPIYLAASGPLAAKLAGRVADGYIATSGKDPQLYRDLLGALAEGAEAAQRDVNRIDRFIEIKVSYDKDADYARDACHFWAPLALKPEEKTGIDDALEMEQAADKILDRAHTRFIVSDDPEEVVERIAPYVEVGFTHLVFHGPGHDQERFLRGFCTDVLPKLHDRFGRAATTTSPGEGQ
ncbi:glucose-6-phosphate dehydrogenase (coenzyme-F420) [Pseudonocardia endophytica]|uniref:Coenzyme F420-dependent glucose-6-phosphate dehydrogenase n=1 Tax=Pseudonocardia endophytica TaxID=401976 RepID=A0A4R1HI49_PSEEN|nr:glucose-6-phosphate dehydrogenase (coenzyme-F420) [Pseudonocardia endophytica]TCK21917.1 coenzyme F420-dependent glucose-6-phosphate dehydrogenase [Pseudonocardia endophytica]